MRRELYGSRESAVSVSVDDGSPTPPRDDGGPAFPLDATSTLRRADRVTAQTGDRSDAAFTDVMNGCQGMALRDYFAAAALQGMTAAPGATIDIGGQNLGINRAKLAYALADAMIAARSA